MSKGPASKPFRYVVHITPHNVKLFDFLIALRAWQHLATIAFFFLRPSKLTCVRGSIYPSHSVGFLRTLPAVNPYKPESDTPTFMRGHRCPSFLSRKIGRKRRFRTGRSVHVRTVEWGLLAFALVFKRVNPDLRVRSVGMSNDALKPMARRSRSVEVSSMTRCCCSGDSRESMVPRMRLSGFRSQARKANK